MLVLDTNVYLDADRDAAFEGRLVTLLAAWREPIGLSSVVVAELLVGVRDADERCRFLGATIDVVSAERVLTPDGADWQTAGDALNALGGADDFQRIGRVIPVAVVPRPA